MEKEWGQQPIDILSGAYLISDPASSDFGGTIENPAGRLTQYIRVYLGLEITLLRASGNSEANSWIGYSRSLSPVSVLQSGRNNKDGKKAVVMTVPEDIYYFRGSCVDWEGQPRVWVKNLAVYALASGLGRPDYSFYTEITRATIYQRTRNPENRRFDEKTNAYPSIGDVFFYTDQDGYYPDIQ